MSEPVRAPAGPGLAAVRFAGLRINPLTVDQAVAVLAERDRAAAFATFVTPNVEHAYLRRHDSELALTYETCLISTNDSRVLRRAALLAGMELQFAPGAYVVDRLFRRVIGPDDALCVVGCTVEIIDALKAQFGLTRVAQHIPPMGFIHDPRAVSAAVDFVAAHPSRFVFVAMGPPQSEHFCNQVVRDGRARGVGLCIGSSLSVLTGRTDPAPAWMEKAGLVWLYRLAKEPRRLWRRYLVRDLAGLWICAADILAIRLGLRRSLA